MSYLDKTFCASPQCKNDCGRRMTDAQREQLTYSQAQYVSYGYFCGQDDKPVTRLKAVHNPIDLTPPLPEGMTILDGVQELA